MLPDSVWCVSGLDTMLPPERRPESFLEQRGIPGGGLCSPPAWHRAVGEGAALKAGGLASDPSFCTGSLQRLQPFWATCLHRHPGIMSTSQAAEGTVRKMALRVVPPHVLKHPGCGFLTQQPRWCFFSSESGVGLSRLGSWSVGFSQKCLPPSESSTSHKVLAPGRKLPSWLLSD